jgi:ubiquinone/menaquinone biosynthesis C-methylase UbiE
MVTSPNSDAVVVDHYGNGGVEERILGALRAAGKDIEHLAADDIADMDEFHLGWRAMTAELARDLGLDATQRVLDVGSGIGGPARYFASAHGCSVTGVDLTQEYVAVATSLSARCGLSHLVSFLQASALALPLEDRVFDAATLIHVGMNIADKRQVFAEVHRVLKPGARFGIYDIMQLADGELTYPLPWAVDGRTSFVERPQEYRRLLEDSGFEVLSETNRRQPVLALADRMRAAAVQQGTAVRGLPVLMGPAGPERLGNVMAPLHAGIIAPIQLVAVAR